jgi:hypothetical protein
MPDHRQFANGIAQTIGCKRIHRDDFVDYGFRSFSGILIAPAV